MALLVTPKTTADRAQPASTEGLYKQFARKNYTNKMRKNYTNKTA